MAGQGQLNAGPKGGRMDARDDRLWARGDRVEQGMRGIGYRHDSRVVARFEVAHDEMDVGADRKYLARAGKHDAFHLAVGAHLVERPLQLLHEHGTYRVELVGPVHRQRGDAGGPLDPNHRQ